MTTLLKEKALQLAMDPTECNWFQYFAQETWDRIGFARTRKGLRIFETTITQNLIFEYLLSKELYSLSPATSRTWAMDIRESVNERANGNDIELFVQIGDNIYFFAIQAKIINHEGFKRAGMIDGNYRYISHQVGGTDQADLLQRYAVKKGGIPLYLLYNYVKSSFNPKSLCNIPFGIQQYGCSVVSTEYIVNKFRSTTGTWTIPQFKDLHPKVALPWFVLACCFHRKNIDDILKMLGLSESISEDSLTMYTLNEIQQDQGWKPVSPFLDYRNDSDSDNIDSIEFNPKYQFLLTTELSTSILRKR